MKTERQNDALRIIYDYFKKNGSYPSNLQMAKFLGLDANRWGNTRRWMMDQNKLIESVSSDFELHPNILESFRQKEEQLSKLNNNRDSEKLPTQLSFSENQTRLPEPPKESPQAVANLPNDSALLSSIKIPLI